MSAKRHQRGKLFLGLAIVVVTGAIAAALLFGERSPVITKGRIVLPDNLVSQAQGMRTLYLIVRDEKSPLPMPWGALSVTLNQDPGQLVYEFLLTKENLRIMATDGAQDHPEYLTIKARLDLDGLGGPDVPGDIVGQVSHVSFGSTDVEITLNTLVSEPAGTSPNSQTP